MDTATHTITDNRYSIEIPEGAELSLNPAGPWVRAMALLIDWLIKFGVFIAFSAVLGMLGRTGQGLYLIVFFLLTWFYPVFFEVFMQGQTPGKKSYKLRVVSADGTALTFSSSLLRNLLRTVDFLPFAYVLGVISCLTTRRFQRLGDVVAGTMVIYVADALKRPHIEAGATSPVPVYFTTEEQRHIVNFSERSDKLSEARQQELASVLKPILDDEHGHKTTDNPVLRLRNMARFIIEK